MFLFLCILKIRKYNWAKNLNTRLSLYHLKKNIVIRVFSTIKNFNCQHSNNTYQSYAPVEFTLNGKGNRPVGSNSRVRFVFMVRYARINQQILYAVKIIMNRMYVG